ncbi:DUF4190 domain-containing protein [Actinomadura terrae]|uniref:DUF4190 domain-containing protein n=1 Tax=Actinomadura terrae TaxID=604353 RepID=UPI001FA7E7D6|nr:DUF4190 domain-containing protein [Actinomadura terrae]
MPGGPGGPGGPGMGPGFGQQRDDDKTNGMAIAAFVTGLLGCLGVLGLILGLIARHQIKERGGKGGGLATAGIALSSLWVAFGLIATVYSVTSGGSDGDDKGGAKPTVTSTKPKKVDARKMKVGDCINDNSGAATTTASEGPVEVESVKIVPCAGPHDGEVLATFKLGGLFPSENEMSRKASAGCKRLMAPRLRREPAARSLATSYYYPTAESWTRGDRAVTCVAVHATEGRKLTRPIHR